MRFVFCGERITATFEYAEYALTAVSLASRFYLRNGFARLVALRGRVARRLKKGVLLPAAIGKANAPTSKIYDNKFYSLSYKMPTHIILPESLIL